MNRTAFKIAASTSIVAMTLTGFTAPSGAVRRQDNVQQRNRGAVQLHEQALRAIRDGRLAEAVQLMEQAVAASPRDVGYRLLLADAYLKTGRFDSARTTYSDVIELDPSNVRANLSVALLQVAQGRPAAAVARLDEIAAGAPAADVGLAYALAGEHRRAIEILESAARSPGATARTRQNLALAYAMVGDWRRSRAIAAQDVSPADLSVRLYQWAAFSRPGADAQRVAALLGVSPGQDPGQPVQLALAAPAPAAPVQVAEAMPAPTPAPAPAPVEVAAVDTGPAEAETIWVPTAQAYQPVAEIETPAPAVAPAPPPARAPVRFASAAPAPIQPTPVPASAAEPAAAPVQMAAAAEAEDGPAPPAPVLPPREVEAYRAAARSLVAPRPQLRRAAYAAATPAPLFQRARPVVRSGNARYVVQLGAFISEANAERAWLTHSRRYDLDGRRPLTTTIEVNGRIMHRVSVSGFASAGDAQRLCGQIKAEGGVCFVRAQAGDAAIRWAARYADPRRRNV